MEKGRGRQDLEARWTGGHGLTSADSRARCAHHVRHGGMVTLHRPAPHSPPCHATPPGAH